MKNHPMFQSLFSLRGNPKACVLTEPLWGIPFHLYMPFVSVYLLAIGANDVQIGIVASMTLLVRALTSAVSGAVTDKFGRRRTTIIFDLVSWSLPCLLWAMSQNVYWFYVAAVFNGLWQMTENSWTCLLVEDAEKSQMVNIYSWIHLSGQLAVFFAPLSGLLVGRIGIVPAMRILYVFSFLMMTAKFLILYRYCDETKVGKVRMAETKGQSIFAVLGEYRGLLPRFFASSDMRLAMVISVLFTAVRTIMENFFGVLTTQRLGLPEQYLAYFPILRSAILLFFILFLQLRISKFGFKGPMLLGVALYIASHLLLIATPGRLLGPILYTLLEACAHGLAMPRKDSLVALCLDPEERARMTSIMTVVVLGFNIPFGYVAGVLSEINRSFPFWLNVGLFAVAFVVIAASRRLSRENSLEAAG